MFDGQAGVSFGEADNPHAADKMGTYAGNYDGIIRNNMIFANVAAFDCGICLEQAMGAKVIANTVIRTGGATTGNAIEYRFANSMVTVDDSIATITAQLGVKPQLEYMGGVRGWPGDSPLIHLDCERIRALGWRPTLSIRDAIRRTVDWLEQNPGILDERAVA